MANFVCLKVREQASLASANFLTKGLYLVTRYSLLFTYYALRFTFHALLITLYSLLFTYYASRFTFHALRFTSLFPPYGATPPSPEPYPPWRGACLEAVCCTARRLSPSFANGKTYEMDPTDRRIEHTIA